MAAHGFCGFDFIFALSMALARGGAEPHGVDGADEREPWRSFCSVASARSLYTPDPGGGVVCAGNTFLVVHRTAVSQGPIAADREAAVCLGGGNDTSVHSVFFSRGFWRWPEVAFFAEGAAGCLES